MKHPMLQERKLLQPVLSALVDKCQDTSSTVCQMAVRGLGNLASGAPEKVRMRLLLTKGIPEHKRS